MSPDVKAEIHIPDIWYDFFARFLPGVTFIVALRILIFNQTTIPQPVEIAALFFLGYVAALMTQPISSFFTALIESKWGSLPKGETDRAFFIQKIQYELGDTSRQAQILSKMHAEATLFVQLAVFSIIMFIIHIIYGSVLLPSNSRCYILVFALWMIGNAFEVISRRLKRAVRLKKVGK